MFFLFFLGFPVLKRFHPKVMFDLTVTMLLMAAATNRIDKAGLGGAWSDFSQRGGG